ncbi:unnamed protein product [Dovyalis caffra]|uniref:TPX2 C-terminal domain-containing protein n=1 Tax=Dovyalis caffra TaxID=77055 RepID=A0AAV1QYH3_9ROSI|nr:unnamed protein product [Dovyalis caffra]
MDAKREASADLNAGRVSLSLKRSGGFFHGFTHIIDLQRALPNGASKHKGLAGPELGLQGLHVLGSSGTCTAHAPNMVYITTHNTFSIKDTAGKSATTWYIVILRFHSADSLHSGSISFGRFESEDLSWERRSSFSHNRYLEEVEKCSKPGSVIQKKAYFEAHFKKKGILLPGSFDGLSGRGCQDSEEDDGYENLGQGEEDDATNGSCNYSHCEDSVLENVDCDEFDCGNQGGQFDYVEDESHHACFDESAEGSECQGPFEVIGCGGEDPVVLSSESQMEATLDDATVLVKGVDEDVKQEEAHQIETGLDESHLNNDKPEMEMKDNLNDYAANIDKSSTTISLSSKSGTAKDLDNTSAVHRQNFYPKLRASVESKSMNPRERSPINGSQFQKILNNVSRTAAKNQHRRERETQQRTKSEKQSPRAATPTRRVLHKAKSEENSESGNSRLYPVNRSEKESRVKKFESPPSRSNKVEPIAHLSANRTKQIVSSTKPDTKPIALAFSFKSHERAERRKEFYMKLEEKLHAKEAEMNQIQVKTQEKTQAEIKQLRKSLNFKATPMPSFYHVAVPPGSNGNKASLSKTKPAKVRHKSTSPASGAAARSQLLSRAGNDQALSANESVKTTNQPEPLGRPDHPTTKVSEAHETSLINNNRHKPEALTKTGATGKNERGKVKDANLQRYGVSENTKISKDLKVEGKAKMGNHRSSSEMLRKSIKRIGIGSNSGMGNLAVGSKGTKVKSGQTIAILYQQHRDGKLSQSTAGNSMFPHACSAIYNLAGLDHRSLTKIAIAKDNTPNGEVIPGNNVRTLEHHHPYAQYRPLDDASIQVYNIGYLHNLILAFDLD